MVGGAFGGWLVGWRGGAVETHGGSLGGATAMGGQTPAYGKSVGGPREAVNKP